MAIEATQPDKQEPKNAERPAPLAGSSVPLPPVLTGSEDRIHIKREIIYLKPPQTTRYILIALLALNVALMFALQPLAKKVIHSNRIAEQPGFWLPDASGDMQNAIALNMDGAKYVIICSTLFSDKWLLDLAKQTRSRGAKVVLLLDGLVPYRSLNLENRGFYSKSSFGLYLNNTRANLHLILIDGKQGFMSTGPLNSAWRSTPGRVYQLPEKDCAALWGALLKRLEESDDGYKVPGV